LVVGQERNIHHKTHPSLPPSFNLSFPPYLDERHLLRVARVGERPPLVISQENEAEGHVGHVLDHQPLEGGEEGREGGRGKLIGGEEDVAGGC